MKKNKYVFNIIVSILTVSLVDYILKDYNNKNIKLLVSISMAILVLFLIQFSKKKLERTKK